LKENIPELRLRSYILKYSKPLSAYLQSVIPTTDFTSKVPGIHRLCMTYKQPQLSSINDVTQQEGYYGIDVRHSSEMTAAVTLLYTEKAITSRLHICKNA